MLKKILVLFITLWVSTSLSNAYAESSVWKISKNDDYFYLGGSIHLLSPADHPLPQEFITAYNDSDEIIFEADIAESKSSNTQNKFLAAMTHNSSENLASKLQTSTYESLRKFLASRSIPIEAFSQFQPWAVSVSITVMEYQRLGMVPEYGVEEYFYQKSIADNKKLSHLESIDEQISFLQSMGKIEPNVIINATIRDLNQLPTLIDTMKDNWKKGDIEGFTASSAIIQMRTEFPELYQTIVIDRNNNWMPTLTDLANNGKKEFVLVGALHLNDKDGLLNQLRLRGFKVTQL